MLTGQRGSPLVLLVILTGLNLANYIDRYLLNGVLVPIQTEFGLDDRQLGRLNTAFMASYFLASPFFGLLGDRWRRTRLILFGVGLGSLGTMATCWAPSFALLVTVRSLVGFGEASYASVAPSLIADAYEPRTRNAALSVFYVALPLGAALGFILGGQLNEAIGWRAAFLWVGLASLVLSFAIQGVREPARGRFDSGGEYRPPAARDAFALVRNRAYLLCIAGYTAYTFAMGAMSIWAPVFLQRYHGETNASATLFFGMVAVVTGIVGTLAGGYLASRVARTRPDAYRWNLVLSVSLAVPAVICALVADSAIVSKASFAVAMFLLFLSTGPVNTVIFEVVPANLRSTAMALSIFSIHLFGDLWSPEFAGYLSTHWHSLRSALTIVPLALAGAALFWGMLALRRYRPAE